jgi:hypothetical protein
MSTRSALAPFVVVLLLSLGAPLHTAAIVPSSAPGSRSVLAVTIPAHAPLRISAPLRAASDALVAQQAVRVQPSRESSAHRHVWTNADLAHLAHQPATPDPNLDRIIARLAATQYRWYPSPENYGGPVDLAEPYRPAWQNAPFDWPTRRDRFERGGPYPVDDGVAPAFGLPLFGCWGCRGFPAHGHIVRQPRLRTDGRGMSNDAGARQHPVPRARGRQ